MLALLAEKFDSLILTEYRTNPRAVPVAELDAIAAQVAPGVPRRKAADPIAAWELARAGASPGELICVAGSFFLAAELRRHIATHPIAAPPADALAAG
jgi:dihydrofolate synthase/folylpolyglutamate synthase